MTKRKESCETCYCNEEDYCHLEPPKLLRYDLIEQCDGDPVNIPVFGYPQITNIDWCICWVSHPRHRNKHLHNNEQPYDKHSVYECRT